MELAVLLWFGSSTIVLSTKIKHSCIREELFTNQTYLGRNRALIGLPARSFARQANLKILSKRILSKRIHSYILFKNSSSHIKMASASGSKATNKDWMFCPYTGSLLQLDAVKNVASSQLSGYAVSLNGRLII